LLSDADGHESEAIIAKRCDERKSSEFGVGSERCRCSSTSRHTPATKLTNGRVNLRSTNKYTTSLLWWIGGTSLTRRTSKCGVPKGRHTLLRYDEDTDEWTFQSGFDGDELLARPSIRLVTVDAEVVRQAEREIESCEHCHPDNAEIPFDWLLAEVTGKHGTYEFMLSETARCPTCKQPITEKTLLSERISRSSKKAYFTLADLYSFGRENTLTTRSLPQIFLHGFSNPTRLLVL
jgi:hypothetical protein